MSPRRKLALKIAGTVAATIFVALVLASIEISRHLKDLIPAWLSQQYNGTVQLSDFHASLAFPFVQCEAESLAVRFEGREDLPPMISIRTLTLRASIWELLRTPTHVNLVHLDGLEINVPPRQAGGKGSNEGPRRFMRRTRSVRFDQIVVEGAVLKILTQQPGKLPHEFDIHKLYLSSTQPEGALAFHAELTNPSPPGEITSSGTFGPWNIDSPSLTPVAGAYLFKDADLGVFRGIAGILSSQGNYQGVLEKIAVNGTTDIPDFRVARAGHPLDLSTKFDATVDGTDGNTYLHPVEAHFGKTTLIAQGKVERLQGKPGRDITLDVTADNGRIEDLLQLAVKANPPMAGPVRLKTKFVLDSGQKTMMDRLNLGGSFSLDSIHFTNGSVQQRIDNLSKRSEGKPKEVVQPSEAISEDDVASEIRGSFTMKDGILRLSAVQFQIPGAAVEISGIYALEPQALDLYGTLKMQASLSQTTTGMKSFLLRLADPIFSRHGGTVLPIKITGPVDHPHYALNLHHRGAEGETAK